MFDRELLRRGETVSMKHFVRDETDRGLAYTAPEHLPDTLVITHPGSGQEVTQPIAWSGQPGALGAKPVGDPEERRAGPVRRGPQARRCAALGGRHVFRVETSACRSPTRAWRPRGVLVAPSEVAFEAQINAQAGGRCRRLPLALSALLRDEARRALPASRTSASPLGRSRDDDESDADSGNGDSGARVVARQIPARTDAQGAARLVVPGLPALRGPAELQAEVSFADPNGDADRLAPRRCGRRRWWWPARRAGRRTAAPRASPWPCSTPRASRCPAAPSR
ncbi:MAG: MG2 domain-containing protein [Rubrivivax sp.]